MSPSTTDITGELVEALNEHLDVDEDNLTDVVEELRSYKVPTSEIRRRVINRFTEGTAVTADQVYGTMGEDSAGSGQSRPSDTDAIEDVSSRHEDAIAGGDDGSCAFLDLAFTYVQDWSDDLADSVKQQGLIQDESGRTKLTIWGTADGVPELEEGESYLLAGVATDKYVDDNGDVWYSVTAGSNVDAYELDECVAPSEAVVEGAIVNIQGGSGLIKRCTNGDCTRVLRNGRCSVHGEVDGEFDLRIKADIDDGRDTRQILFDEEMTTEIAGLTLNDAKEMAMDALDTDVVANEIEATIQGRHIEVEGPVMGEYLLVNSFSSDASVSESELEAAADEHGFSIPTDEQGSDSEAVSEAAERESVEQAAAEAVSG
jgi:replication factor A1